MLPVTRSKIFLFANIVSNQSKTNWENVTKASDRSCISQC